jgi:hypothetical protein
MLRPVLLLAAIFFGGSLVSAQQALGNSLNREQPRRLRRTPNSSLKRCRKHCELGLEFPEKLEVPAGKYEAKFPVRDNLGGLVGSISLPVDMK